MQSAGRNEHTVVTHRIMGRLGNNILQIYRAFWFAAIHGIPFEHVVIRNLPGIVNRPICSRIRSNFVAQSEFDKYVFNKKYNCCGRLTKDVRRDLYDMHVDDGDGVEIIHGSFTYPDLPWEKALFAYLFDNTVFRLQVASAYESVLCGGTVGYAIRHDRDTAGNPKFRTLTVEQISRDLCSITDKYRGLCTVVITSDDTGFADSVVSTLTGDTKKHMYVVHDSPDVQLYLLSMCDYVINNGQYQCTSAWANDPDTVYESTFAQLAQCLNRSYAFHSFPHMPAKDESQQALTREGCPYDYPCLINP